MKCSPHKSALPCNTRITCPRFYLQRRIFDAPRVANLLPECQISFQSNADCLREQTPLVTTSGAATTVATDREGGGILVTSLKSQGVHRCKIAPRSLFMTTRFNEDRWSGVEWSEPYMGFRYGPIPNHWSCFILKDLVPHY